MYLSLIFLNTKQHLFCQPDLHYEEFEFAVEFVLLLIVIFRHVMDDYALARNIFPEDFDLQLVQETLALSYDALKYDFGQLAAQIHNRLLSVKKTQV